MKCKNCGAELDHLKINVFNRDGSDSSIDVPIEEFPEDAIVFETDQNWCGYDLSEEEMMDDIRCPCCGKFPGEPKHGIQVYDVVRVVFFKDADHDGDEDHWIPVTEQLPKTDGRFMVTIKGKSGKPHVEMRNFHAGAQKWESQLGYVEENILAWQARPRPYGWKPRQADTELYGHWIYWDGWCGNHDRRIDDATCSVCGYKHPTVRATKEEWDTRTFLSDTCPGCGAKMKKGETVNVV